ncbi:MAG TPA: prephenate dehydrogenase/arogenate dehydrogenase family protein [Pirellulales bacterium]|jgi:prephenate dehydrogenase|nr:prephenate dehydrogenase/arogenate dehydrogenase family protein [Pirellulales bacterium]
MWKTVTIVGVGLIGGSIGLALRERELAERVIGVGRRAASLRKAKSMGAVSATTLSLEQGVAEADVVVVCTPIAQIPEQILQASSACRPSALITDAGSTKATIVQILNGQLPESVRFVGSHPLAGSEKSGPEAASADLFEGRIVVVTPGPTTREGVAADAADFWSALGATVFMMNPKDHDAALASTSHLPHLLASLLAGVTPRADLPLTATGWQDTTRIAAGDPELWAQILLDNKRNVLKSLARFEKTMQRAKTALERSDSKTLQRLLAEAKAIRDAVGS